MKKRIMIVDDNIHMISLVKKGIERSTDEYEVIGVDSGKKCLEFLENNQIPDLILLDIMMPEMSGWNTLEKLKENPLWEKIPIIFLTAVIDEYSLKLGRMKGQDYIQKPFNIDDLVRRIDKILNQKMKKS